MLMVSIMSSMKLGKGTSITKTSATAPVGMNQSEDRRSVASSPVFLLTVGAVGTFICLSGVAWIFISQSHQAALLALLVTYVAFFSMSQGAVIWVYISEVFPTSVRSKGQGIGSASHWIMNTIIAFAFPVLATRFGAGIPFVVFASFTLLQLFVVALFYPETKGQTLEELQRRLVKA